MKYIKEFNGSKYFNQEEIDDIKDIFQDIIDEYNIEPYDNNYLAGNSFTLKYLLFRYLDDIILHRNNHQPSTSIRIILFSIIKDSVVLKYERQEELDADINNFIERLKNMGFKVEMNIMLAPVVNREKKVVDQIRIVIKK